MKALAYLMKGRKILENVFFMNFYANICVRELSKRWNR